MEDNRQKGVIKTVIKDEEGKSKGFGFIAPEDGGDDIFVHYSACEGFRLDDSVKGRTVTFTTEEGPKGLKAANVQLLEDDGDEDSMEMDSEEPAEEDEMPMPA